MPHQPRVKSEILLREKDLYRVSVCVRCCDSVSFIVIRSEKNGIVLDKIELHAEVRRRVKRKWKKIYLWDWLVLEEYIV